MTRTAKTVAYILIALLLVGLRIYHIDADPPSWLSWSSGIYSDEGIYATDARSVVLFGHWSPGNFHPAEITPLHHLVLLALFKAFGMSLVSARFAGIATSLIGLLFFYLTLRRQFDETTGFVGVLFLGLSPMFLFYNRLALLESPTVCLLIIAAYLLGSPNKQLLCGLTLALAIIYKPLALLCAPAFFVDVRDKTIAFQRLVGLFFGLAFYYAVWQMPHYAYLAGVNHYYLMHQYLPHSLNNIEYNLIRSLWTGSSDGVAVYFLHHEAWTVAFVVFSLFTRRIRADERLRTYWVWSGVPLVAFCLMSYEPSRYFILISPPMATVAAFYTSRLPNVWRTVATTGVLILDLCVIAPTLANAHYLVRDSGAKIVRTCGAETEVAGQYAPEAALSNHLKCFYVQPALANSDASLSGVVVIVTVSPYWNNYWSSRLMQYDSKESLGAIAFPRRQRLLCIMVHAAH